MPEPMTPERLAEIEQRYGGHPKSYSRDMLDLVAEIQRLRGLVSTDLDVRWQGLVRSHEEERRKRQAAEARVRELEAAVQEAARLLKRFTHWNCECPPEVEAWLDKYDIPSQGGAQEVSDE